MTKKLRTQPVPTRIRPSWAAVAEYAKAHGEMILPPDLDRNSAHASLHKRGCGMRAVVIHGEVVAFSVKPLQTKAEADTKAGIRTRMQVEREIQPVPMKSFPNWVAVAEYAKAHGEMILPPDVDRHSSQSTLQRFGFGIAAVVVGNQIVACRVRPLVKRGGPQSKAEADTKAGIRTRMRIEREIQPVPMKSFPNWVAVAEYAKAHGEMILPPDVDRNKAHAPLSRQGCGIRAIVLDGEVVGARVQPLSTRPKEDTKSNAGITASSPIELRIQPVPTKIWHDWVAVATYVKSHGEMRLPANVDHNSAHAPLNRLGCEIRPIVSEGQVIACRVTPLQPEPKPKRVRKQNTKPNTHNRSNSD